MKTKSFFLNILCLLLVVALPFGASAQEDESDLSIGVSMNLDAFFGFNSMLTGAYPINDGLDFTFYGIQWGAGTALAGVNGPRVWCRSQLFGRQPGYQSATGIHDGFTSV